MLGWEASTATAEEETIILTEFQRMKILTIHIRSSINWINVGMVMSMMMSEKKNRIKRKL